MLQVFPSARVQRCLTGMTSVRGARLPSCVFIEGIGGYRLGGSFDLHVLLRGLAFRDGVVVKKGGVGGLWMEVSSAAWWRRAAPLMVG